MSSPEQAVAPSPCKQLTPQQHSLLKDSDFEMTWDSSGWLTGVGVKGLPNTEPLRAIPRKAVNFYYYCQLCTGSFVRCRNPEHPGILVYSPVLSDEFEYEVYKQWHSEFFQDSDSRRIPSHAKPKHLSELLFIARTIFYRVKENRLAPDQAYRVEGELINLSDADKTEEFWRALGYQSGRIDVNGVSIIYLGYRFENTGFVIFDGTSLPRDVSIEELIPQVTLEQTDERGVLKNMNLSDRCLVCGHKNHSVFDISYPCHFCLRRVSDVVFNPSR